MTRMLKKITLEDLHVILKRCAEEARSAKFVLIARSNKGRILEYEERTLPITDLKWVSEEEVLLAENPPFPGQDQIRKIP